MEPVLTPDVQRYGVAEIEALYRTAPIGLCVLDRELRFVRVNERFAQMTGVAPAGHIGRPVRELLPTLADQAEPLLRRVIQTGEPIVGVELVGETGAAPGVERTWMDNFAPIRGGDGAVVGVNIAVEEVTELRALQAEQSERELLHKLAQALQQSREEDRASIARELHDEIGQMLTISALDVRELLAELPPLPRDPAARLNALAARLAQGMQTVRRISQGLRPPSLDVVGIRAAIEEYIAEFRDASGMSLRFTAPPNELQLSGDRATALFRVLQEALVNVARHSGASAVDVILRDDARQVSLTICDNGRGMPAPGTARRGLGLLGMTERMRAHGGRLRIGAAEGGGTCLIAAFPKPPTMR